MSSKNVYLKQSMKKRAYRVATRQINNFFNDIRGASDDLGQGSASFSGNGEDVDRIDHDQFSGSVENTQQTSMEEGENISLLSNSTRLSCSSPDEYMKCELDETLSFTSDPGSDTEEQREVVVKHSGVLTTE
jgi:hypothetical protein